MNIAFASGNPHLPQLNGGVEVNTHVLAGELIRRGNKVSVLAKLSLRSAFGLRRAARAVSEDRGLGYPVFRSRRPWAHAAEMPRPDVAVVQNGPMLEFALDFARLGVPTVAYLHGLSFEDWPADSLPFRGYIANSRFTAERFRRLFAVDAAVVPPLIARDDYLTPVTGTLVTLINPIPVKGVDLALEVAALCPDIPFCFVRGWPLGWRGEAALRRRLSGLPNVALRPSHADMRPVYRDTRILIVPSQLDETWGRVVSEAQVSGIPVIASGRGGLPEAVGGGGIVLDREAPASVWAGAIREMWSDDARYRELSRAALCHSERRDLDPDRQVATLIGELERVIERP